jgi:cytochrome c oxidase subunit 4
MTGARHKSPGVRVYVVAYVALIALLAATVGAAFVPWPRVVPGAGWGVGIALTIAAAKGLVILLYFMHVKYSPRMVWAFAGAGFLWLGIMFTLTFSDYVTRNHPAGANPKGEPRYLNAAPPPGGGPGEPGARPSEHSSREAERRWSGEGGAVVSLAVRIPGISGVSLC